MGCKGKECKICTDGKWFDQIKRDALSGSRRRNKQNIECLFNRLICAEADLDYYQCVQSGDWPDAVDVLERWLKQAKAKAEALMVDEA